MLNSACMGFSKKVIQRNQVSCLAHNPKAPYRIRRNKRTVRSKSYEIIFFKLLSFLKK